MIDINYGVILTGNVQAGGAFTLEGGFQTSETISVNGSMIMSTVDRESPHYPGPYAVTPTRESQVLNTARQVLDSNITVGAIPNNYGLITWDGTVITVS